MVVALWGITVIIFALTRLSGDPARLMMGESYSEKYYLELRQSLGLDRPVYVQYGLYIRDVARGDFGQSWRFRKPAMPIVMSRLPATAQLGAAAMALVVLVAIPMGMLAAVKRGSFFDTFGKGFALVGQSMPTFWVGLMLILLLSVSLRWLPASGRDGPANMLMPTLTLAWFSMAALTRLTRSAMLDVIDSDFIKMARVKGAPESVVVFKHALKNAAIPIVTLLGLQLAGFLRGAVIVETIFAWPGVGKLALDAAMGRDFPLVQAAVLVTAVVFLLTNFAVDILYGYLDPRIRYTK
ncbi:MAG: ABC transporter permease [Chloroflexi bacterium]|nr:ABC transporter permease [Chloroflexota bacterium]